MVALPTHKDPTLEAIDQALIELDQSKPRRGYLGASSIGHPCERKLWYDFRHCTEVEFDAATLKRFDDGHRGEDLMAERLRMVEGIMLATHKSNGGQYGFSLFGGHFKGHYDGIIKGILQAPKTPHIWEHKQVGESVQNKLQKCINDHGEKQALKEWNPVYYAQAVLYMNAEQLPRHYLTCSTPGGRNTISVRTEENPADAGRLKAKAERIIFHEKPPVKLSDDPAFYQCKWCDHYNICHQRSMPKANCRTCVWNEPTQQGSWLCRKHDKEAVILCDDHRYIPELLPYELVNVDPETESVIYKNKQGKTFKNGPQDEDSYLSTELENLPEEMIGDLNIAAFRKEANATIVNTEVPF